MIGPQRSGWYSKSGQSHRAWLACLRPTGILVAGLVLVPLPQQAAARRPQTRAGHDAPTARLSRQALTVDQN